MKNKINTIRELTVLLANFKISANTLAVICGVNESQMRQYVAGIRNPSPKTIAKINEKIRIFADELKEFQITGA